MAADLEVECVNLRIGDRVFGLRLPVAAETMPPELRDAVVLHGLALRHGHCDGCRGRWWVTGDRLDVAHGEDCPAQRDRLALALAGWMRATYTARELADLRELAGRFG